MAETGSHFNTATEVLNQQADAHEAFERAFNIHAQQMGNIHYQACFDPDQVLASADEYQERMFEAVEAGCFDELTGIVHLSTELTYDYHAIYDAPEFQELAAALAERMQSLTQRRDVLLADMSGYDTVS